MTTEIERAADINRKAWRYAIGTGVVSAAVGGVLFLVAPSVAVVLGILATGQLARIVLPWHWRRGARRRSGR